MNYQLSKEIRRELKNIPSFINPKKANHHSVYTNIHNEDSSFFYAIKRSCEQGFLDEENIEEMSFDISIEMCEIGLLTDADLINSYYDYFLIFIKYLEQVAVEDECYEASSNLKRLHDHIKNKES